MNKIERVQAALRGEAVDQVPVSFWGHAFDSEDSASALAQSTLEFNRTYDWEFHQGPGQSVVSRRGLGWGVQ